MRYILLFSLILGYSYLLSAQDLSFPSPDGHTQDCGLTLSGKVLDHDTREMLVGATVYIPELERAAVADAYGNYHFHHLCRGTYNLRVTFIGYQTEAYTVRLTSSAIRNLELHLDAEMLSTVEVVGARLTAQAQTTLVLSDRELAETRGLTLGESLKRLPGVSTLQTGPTISKPVIHGMHSSRILILNNGVRQEGQQWGAEHAPEIDPFNASQIKVIKGAAGVRYGSDAIAGVILVEPKSLPDSAGLGGEINLVGSTNNRQGTASGLLEGNISGLPGLSWRLQGTYKIAGNSKAADYYLDNTGAREQNYSAALGYSRNNYGTELYFSQFHTKLGILSDSHVSTEADIRSAISRERPASADYAGFTYSIAPPFQDVNHSLLKSRTYLDHEELGKFEFIYGWQRNLRQEYDVHTDERPSLELDLNTHTTETVWSHLPVNGFSGSAGINTIYQRNTWQYDAFMPYYTSFTTGAFALEKWRKDRLQLEAGIRYDYKFLQVKTWKWTGSGSASDRELLQPEYNFNNVSGTLSALYDVGYHLTFGLNMSSAWRAPGANELFSEGVHHSTATYERGNPDLKSEQAFNTELSVNYYGNKRLNGYLSIYNNFINNYIYLAPTQNFKWKAAGIYPVFQYKQANSNFIGLDLNLDYRLFENFIIESKASIVRARNLDTQDHLIGIPADRFDNRLRIELGDAGVSQKLSDTYIAIGGVFVAEQSRTPTKTDQDFALAPPSYFLLQAEAGIKLKLGKQSFEIGVTGNNLLNIAYRDYLNRFRYFADETGRMIMFRIRIPIELTSNKI